MVVAVTNARLHTISDGVIDDATVIIRDGKIEEVGEDVRVPEDAKIIDAGGAVVTPGLVEAHGHVGVHNYAMGWEGADVNEATDPITPQVSALDGINPEERGFRDFLRGGITTVQVLPGSANIIGGETVTIKTKPTSVVDEVVIKQPSGMKAALGENPKRAYGQRKQKAPSTRMGAAALMREWFKKAGDYAEKQSGSGDDEENGPEYDAKLEALVGVVKGEVPLRVHAHRADDIATAARIAEEFGIKYSIEHATQGFKIPDFLAERGPSCAVGPCMSKESKVELEGVGYDTAVALHEAGASFCLITDHPVVRALYLHLMAGVASAHGLGDDAALRAVTLSAAEHIGVEDLVGSVQKGKDGDLVIWDGDPLDGRSAAERVIIEGELVYDAAEDDEY